MTRGILSFQKNNVLYSIYSNSDSAPNVLGNYILDLIRRWGIDALSTFIDNIELVDTDGFSIYDIDDCIENNTKFLLQDNTDFMHDSLMCEWAYVVNIDTNELEIYKGFRQSKPIGRFRDIEPQGKYYAVSLVRVYNLNNLPAKMPKNINADYDEIELDIEVSVYNKLKEEAKKRKTSIDALVTEILMENINETTEKIE
jgi:hypothetical protein